MKTNKSKSQKKPTKKAVKKQIEHTLTERFLEAVKGLGHNAELIADDVAKLSKVAARKLAKKFQDVKSAVANKIDDVSAVKKAAPKKIKLAKKDASKLMKKVDKSVTKVVEKAVAKAKPIVSSIKVASIASEEKAAAALQKPLSPLAGLTGKVAPKTKTMVNKTTTAASSANPPAEGAGKAVANNPVKKVPAKAIPTKKNTTSNTTKK